MKRSKVALVILVADQRSASIDRLSPVRGEEGVQHADTLPVCLRYTVRYRTYAAIRRELSARSARRGGLVQSPGHHADT